MTIINQTLVRVSAFSKEVDGTTTRTFLALLDGQPIGSVDINDWQKAGGWVSTVFVAEQYRRLGVARDLFQRIVLDARDAGKTGLGLSVKEENTAAQALYESLGFRVCYAFDGGTLAMTLHL
jgi:ribosomal protein S18 acetylase RimI-like enzyme